MERRHVEVAPRPGGAKAGGGVSDLVVVGVGAGGKQGDQRGHVVVRRAGRPVVLLLYQGVEQAVEREGAGPAARVYVAALLQQQRSAACEAVRPAANVDVE